MISNFSYEVYIPSLGDNIRYNELDNRTYLNMLKFLRNNDDVGLELLLEDLITTLQVSGDKIKMSRLDKYCVVLTIIMVCIGNDLQFTVTCNQTQKEYNVDIRIGDIISKINELKLTDINIKLDDSNSITVSIPASIRGNDVNVIDKIKLNNREYDVSQATDKQIDQIIEHMPYNVFTRMRDTFADIHKQTNNIVYFKHRTPYVADSTYTSYNFNLYDDSFYNFIKTLLREDLLGYYKMYYALTTKFKFDMNYIQSITPAETKMYLSMVREDIKQRQEAIEQSSKSNPGASIPLSMPPDAS